MKPVELIGFKAVIQDLVSNDKRDIAFELLDHFFSQTKTLAELDAIGEMALKSEYRDLYLRCAETANAAALTAAEKYAARSNLIKAYNIMNYPDKALFYTELQLSITPDDFDMLCQKAANTSLAGDKATAEALIDELIVRFPHKKKELEPLLSGRYLRQGDLVKGIRTFIEHIKPPHKLFDEQLKMKRWDGIARPGKKVYIDGEGGIGDEIINIRFFDNLKKMGMTPILCSPNTKYYRDKNAMFRRHGIEILSESFSIDASQFWVPMMSLPAVLELEESDLWTKPYLSPQRQSKNKLTGSRFKIGIKCSGNPYFAQDEYRKIPLERLVSSLPSDADIYYIDKLNVEHPRVQNLCDKITSWEDTLDFIDQMDCIVSSCTSLVHAAGAMGKTTVVTVPIAEYYVWTSSRTDGTTPWYGDHVRVMKQTKVRDWNEPLSNVKKYVAELHSLKSE